MTSFDAARHDRHGREHVHAFGLGKTHRRSRRPFVVSLLRGLASESSRATLGEERCSPRVPPLAFPPPSLASTERRLPLRQAALRRRARRRRLAARGTGDRLMQPTISENEHPCPVRLPASHGCYPELTGEEQSSRSTLRPGGLSSNARGVFFRDASIEAEPVRGPSRLGRSNARFRVVRLGPSRLDRIRRSFRDEAATSSVRVSFSRRADLLGRFADPVASPRPVQLSTCVAQGGFSRARRAATHRACSLRFVSPRLSSTSAARNGSRTRLREARSTRHANA